MAKRKTTRKTAPRKVRTVKIKRRRKSAKRKGMLSEFFNPDEAKNAAKAVLSGAIGGLSAGLLDKAFSSSDPNQRAIIQIGGGFVFASMLKMPNLGAGMAAIGAYNLLKTPLGLAEGDDANYADPIEALPMFLNEDGSAASLAEGEYFLSESNEMLSQNYMLSEDVYPDYVPTFN